jgi:hypothetical protein
MITLDEVVEQYKKYQIEKQIEADKQAEKRLVEKTIETIQAIEKLGLSAYEVKGADAWISFNGELLHFCIWRGYGGYYDFKILLGKCPRCKTVELMTQARMLDLGILGEMLSEPLVAEHHNCVDVNKPEAEEEHPPSTDGKLLEALSNYVHSEIHRYDE